MDLNKGSNNDIFFIILLLFFSSLIILNTFRINLSSVDVSGIRIGNAIDDKYQSIFLKNKKIFIKWDDMNKIKVKSKSVRRPFSSALINIVSITLKNNQKYESFIAQPKGFIKALKQLGKQKLLSKDSKYLEILKK